MDDPPQLGPAQRISSDDDDAPRGGREARLAALRASVQRGLDDVAAGRVVDLHEGIDQVLKSIRDKKAAGDRK